MYRVKLTKRAAKELERLPKGAHQKIIESLDVLRINPFAEVIQFRKLKTRNDLYRVRVGDYRVVYSIHADILLIRVVRVGQRKDVYRYLKSR